MHYVTSDNRDIQNTCYQEYQLNEHHNLFLMAIDIYIHCCLVNLKGYLCLVDIKFRAFPHLLIVPHLKLRS